MTKVLELKGLKSMKALNIFSTLMLGMKMLPMYAGEFYEPFLARVHAMTPEDQEKIIREAVMFVPLEEEEMKVALAFTTDANGIPMGPENMKNLNAEDILERIVAVAMEVARMKIDMVSTSEKKKSQISLST